jgi:hypothetical protein
MADRTTVDRLTTWGSNRNVPLTASYPAETVSFEAEDTRRVTGGPIPGAAGAVPARTSASGRAARFG